MSIERRDVERAIGVAERESCPAVAKILRALIEEEPTLTYHIGQWFRVCGKRSRLVCVGPGYRCCLVDMADCLAWENPKEVKNKWAITAEEMYEMAHQNDWKLDE